MKKITFQRKQRVVKRVLLLLIIAFVSDLSAQTTERLDNINNKKPNKEFLNKNIVFLVII